MNRDFGIIAQTTAKVAAELANGLQHENIEGLLAAYNAAYTTVLDSITQALDKAPVEQLESELGARPAPATSRRAPSDPGTLEIRVGRFRGRTIAEAYDEDPDYVRWYAETGKNEFLRERMERFLANLTS